MISKEAASGFGHCGVLHSAATVIYMRADQARGSRVLKEAGRALLFASALFVVLGGGFALYVRSLPKLGESERAVLRHFPPPNLAQLKLQRDVLLSYAEANPVSVLTSLCMLYVLMQTFAVPGTLSLSLLSGALYGVVNGLLLVSVVSTAGSTCCYMLSKLVGKQLALAVWPEKLDAFGKAVDERRSDMLSYILFLRVTPVLPNTFINISSPVVRVPVAPFIAGTFLGCMPSNFVAVNAGSRLSTLQSFGDLYDAKHLLLGILIGCAALLPAYLRKRSEGGKLD